MSRFAALALFLIALPAFALDKPRAYVPHAAPKVAPVNADVYDLLLLDKARPYWVRFHVRFDGKPYTEIWARALDNLFADLDRNGDGCLDPRRVQAGAAQFDHPGSDAVGLPVLRPVAAARVRRAGQRS